jgi:hypothetical protein
VSKAALASPAAASPLMCVKLSAVSGLQSTLCRRQCARWHVELQHWQPLHAKSAMSVALLYYIVAHVVRSASLGEPALRYAGMRSAIVESSGCASLR